MPSWISLRVSLFMGIIWFSDLAHSNPAFRFCAGYLFGMPRPDRNPPAWLQAAETFQP